MNLPEAWEICIASIVKNRYGETDMKADPATVSDFQDYGFGMGTALWVKIF